MKLRVSLVSTPSKNNDSAIQIAKDLNDLMFAGCEAPPYQRCYVWLAYADNGEVAGFATLRPIDRKMVYLDRVGVLRKYRGNNLQKKFIRVRLALAKKKDYTTAITYTVPDNYASINSLMHTGFSIYCPQWRWAGAEQLYFKKEIQ